MFLSTTEPVSEDGNTLNPTKSPCDRYNFNTVLTRAKSLVVVVGSPRVLLNTEQHMIRLHGDKGRCWSLYLKSCIEHGTLIIPPLVGAVKNTAENFIAELAAEVGAIIPGDPRRSSRANYITKGSISNAAVSEHIMMHGASQSTASQHSATQAKSRIRLVDKHLSSDENVFKQMSLATSVSMQVPSSSNSRSSISMQRPMGSATNPEGSTVNNQLLSSNLAVKQCVKQNRVSIASSERTINAIVSRSVKSPSSPPLSKPTQGWNAEAPKTRKRGIV